MDTSHLAVRVGDRRDDLLDALLALSFRLGFFSGKPDRCGQRSEDEIREWKKEENGVVEPSLQPLALDGSGKGSAAHGALSK